MSLKDKLQIKLNPAFYWRMVFWLGCVTMLTMLGLLWLGATDETADANNSGRRLIIRLSDGSFEKAPPADTNAETPQSAPTNGTVATTASQTTTPSESPITATNTATAQTAIQPPAEPLPEEPVPQSTATVPLNPINDKLREKISIGILPMIAADGTKPWRHYAKPYTLKDSRPMIAIVVTGLGQNKNITSNAIKLPENITLSFSTYAKDINTWNNAARAKGHETMLDLPLEPTNYPASDPGPQGLLIGNSGEENASRLRWNLAKAQAYIGFTLPTNESFSQNDSAFKAFLELANARGIMLALPHEPSRTETRQLLDNCKIAYTTADTILDEELSSEAIEANLTALEKIAAKRGYAVGYTRAIPLTMTELEKWATKLEENGYILVPLSYITSQKFKP